MRTEFVAYVWIELSCFPCFWSLRIWLSLHKLGEDQLVVQHCKSWILWPARDQTLFLFMIVVNRAPHTFYRVFLFKHILSLFFLFLWRIHFPKLVTTWLPKKLQSSINLLGSERSFFWLSGRYVISWIFSDQVWKHYPCIYLKDHSLRERKRVWSLRQWSSIWMYSILMVVWKDE